MLTDNIIFSDGANNIYEWTYTEKIKIKIKACRQSIVVKISWVRFDFNMKQQKNKVRSMQLSID